MDGISIDIYTIIILFGGLLAGLWMLKTLWGICVGFILFIGNQIVAPVVVGYTLYLLTGELSVGLSSGIAISVIAIIFGFVNEDVETY